MKSAAAMIAGVEYMESYLVPPAWDQDFENGLWNLDGSGAGESTASFGYGESPLSKLLLLALPVCAILRMIPRVACNSNRSSVSATSRVAVSCVWRVILV